MSDGFTPWPDIRSHLEKTWQQGEHVCLVGPTGCGKTTLARDILEIRRFVVAFGVKRDDDTLTDFGWPIVRKVTAQTFDAPMNGSHWGRPEKFALWPKMESMEAFQNQHDVFKRALREIFAAGKWTAFLDDLGYLSNTLKLDTEIRALAQQGRSAGITLVSGIQRPARVPVEVYSEPGHLFIWRPGDGRDMKRLMEIAGAGPIDVREMLHLARNMPQHGILYVDVHTGVMQQTILSDSDVLASTG